jgi:hypothetical protein
LEIWKDIKGFEGIYQVSDLGNIKSLNRIDVRGLNRKGKAKRGRINRYGYIQVQLWKNGKSIDKSLHRLVAEAFIPNPQNKPEVNHKDGDKQNNSVDNLEWSSSKENIEHAVNNGLRKTNGENNGRAILTKEDVEYIRKIYKFRDKEFGGKALAEKFGVGQTTISHIIKNESWKDVV